MLKNHSGLICVNNRVLTRKSIFILILFISCISSCGPKIASPPRTTVECNLLLSNIFLGCYSPLNSTNIISYTVYAYVYYRDNVTNDYELFKTATVSSPDPASSSITVTVEIPKAPTPYKIELFADATDCSTCADEEMGPGVPCFQQDLGTHITAARPRLFGGVGISTDNPSSISVSSWQKVPNVQGSCGCEVPKN
jgi:hypothetical protein